MKTVLGFCLFFSDCSIQQSLVHNCAVAHCDVTDIHLKCTVEVSQVQTPLLKI